MSPVNLRVVGLGTAVTVAVLLPLVATARPTGDPVRPAGASAEGDAKPGDLLRELGLGPRTPASAPSASGSAIPAAPAAPERITHCGPELASPEGAEAQTCVLGEEGEVWARTYYRNATARQFDAFLTLMGPGGRTVQVSCPVPAQDEPGTCETPRERAHGAVTAYTAVAELAGAGEGEATPLLLRAGSNTADGEGS